MNRISGILETALYCADIAKSAEFYRRLFSFRTLLESDRLIALDVAGKNVLLLFQAGATQQPAKTAGGVIPPHGATGPSHLAFSIGADDLAPWERQLVAAGVEIESTVSWPGGAKSLYFRDHDEHLVELLTPGFWSIY
jgi:catechol 2,3-dioxygenase-like lactoylglutathione lyase family enzyme